MGSRLVSVPTTRKPCYLSQTAGLHRFLILFKDYNTAAFFTGSGFRVQRYEEKTRYVEKFREIQRKSEKIREKRRIICKFMCISVIFICKFLCISVRIICKSLFISVRIVSFFCSKEPTPQGSFYLFTFLLFYL